MNSVKNINVRVRTKAEMKELPVGLNLFRPVEKYPKDWLPYQKVFYDCFDALKSSEVNALGEVEPAAGCVIDTTEFENKTSSSSINLQDLNVQPLNKKDYADNSNSSHNEESDKRAVDSLSFSSYKKAKTLVDYPLEIDRDREPSGEVFRNVQDGDHCRPDTPTINDVNKITPTHSNQSLIECSMCDYESNDGDDKEEHILNQRNSVKVPVSSQGKEKLKKVPKILKEFIKNEPMCTVSTLKTEDNSQVKCPDLNNEWKKFITKCKRNSYKCSLCSYETLSKHRGKRHSLIHCDNLKLFKCSLCKFGANRKSEMRNHLKQTHDIHSPDDCYKNYNTTEDVNFQKVSFARIFTQELQSFFACSLCDFETTEESLAESHYLVHSDSKSDVYKCSECDYETDCNDTFKRHERNHEVNLILNVERKNEMKKKLQNESDADSDNKNSSIRCKFCDYQSINQSVADKHMLTHDDLKLLKCSQCSFRCSQTSRLKRHEEKRHSQKKFFKKTNKNIRKGKLKIRETISMETEPSGDGNEPHAEKNLFKCSLCHYESNRRHNMKLHIRRHEIKSKRSKNFTLLDASRKEPLETIAVKKESVETLINDTSTSVDCCSRSEEDHTSPTKADSIVENDRFNDDINFYHCSECDYYSDRKVKFQVHLERHCRKSCSVGERKEGEHQKITVPNDSRGSHSKSMSRKVRSKRGRPKKCIDVQNVT